MWSARLVDDDIGVNAANGMLGQNAASANLTGTVAGLVFALVTGLAGTFTACNVAVFSAIAPMLDTGRRSIAGRVRLALTPLGWLSLGAGALVLVAIGNMIVIGVLCVSLALSGLPRWLRKRAGRAATVTATALLTGGTFTFAYWCPRVPANFGFGWFPTVPWH